MVLLLVPSKRCHVRSGLAPMVVLSGTEPVSVEKLLATGHRLVAAIRVSRHIVQRRSSPQYYYRDCALSVFRRTNTY